MVIHFVGHTTTHEPTHQFRQIVTSKTAFSSAKLSEKSSDSDVVFDFIVCSDIFTNNSKRTKLLISSILQRF